MTSTIAAIVLALYMARVVVAIGYNNNTDFLNVINDVVSHFKKLSINQLTIYMISNSQLEYRRNQDIMRRSILGKSRNTLRFRHLHGYDIRQKIILDDQVHIIVIDADTLKTNEFCDKTVQVFWKAVRCHKVVYLELSGSGVVCPRRLSSCSSQVVGGPSEDGDWRFWRAGKPRGRDPPLAVWRPGIGVRGSLVVLTHMEGTWKVMYCDDNPFIVIINGTASGFLHDIWSLLHEKFKFRFKAIPYHKSIWRGDGTRRVYSFCQAGTIVNRPDVALFPTSEYTRSRNYDVVLFGLSGRGAHYYRKNWKAGWQVLCNKELLQTVAALGLAFLGVFAFHGARPFDFFAVLASQRLRGRLGCLVKISAVLVAFFWIVLRANFASTRASFRLQPSSYKENAKQIFKRFKFTAVYRIALSSCFNDYFLTEPTPYTWTPGFKRVISGISCVDPSNALLYMALGPSNTFTVAERERVQPFFDSRSRALVGEELIFDRAPIGFLVKSGVVSAQLLREGVLELSEKGLVKALMLKWYGTQESDPLPWMQLQKDMYLPLCVLVAGLIVSLAVLFLEKRTSAQPATADYTPDL